MPRTRYGSGGVHHLALRITATMPIEEWEQRITSLGYRNSGVVDRHYFRSLYVREPNHILYELATEGPGFEVDGPMDPNRLSLPPFLEPRKTALVWKPKNTTAVDDDKGEKLMGLLETLNEHDDVQNVHANFDIDQKLLEEVAG